MDAEETIRFRLKLYEAGARFEDDEFLRKCFRLKHFRRCPKCDAPMTTTSSRNAGLAFEVKGKCSCGFTFEVDEADLLRATEDDLIGEVVKRAMST